MSGIQHTLVRRNAIRSPSKRSSAVKRLSSILMGLGLQQSQPYQGQTLSYQSGKVKDLDVSDSTLSSRCCADSEGSDEIDIDELYAECVGESWASLCASSEEASRSEFDILQPTSGHRSQSDRKASWGSLNGWVVSSQVASCAAENLGLSPKSMARLVETGRRAPGQRKLFRRMMCRTMDVKLGLGSGHGSGKKKIYGAGEEDDGDQLTLPSGDPDYASKLKYYRESLLIDQGVFIPEESLGYQPKSIRVLKTKVWIKRPSLLGR